MNWFQFKFERTCDQSCCWSLWLPCKLFIQRLKRRAGTTYYLCYNARVLKTWEV